MLVQLWNTKKPQLLLPCDNHTIFNSAKIKIIKLTAWSGYSLEFINSYNSQNATFGIANVQSLWCSHTIGYLLGESRLTLLLPKTCYACPNVSDCSKDFGLQIITKFNQKHRETQIILHFRD